MNKKIAVGMVILLVILGTGFFLMKHLLPQEKAPRQGIVQKSALTQAPLSLEGISYTKQTLPSKHNFVKDRMSPLVGSALLDIDSDGNEEMFIGGGSSQNDVWYQYQAGTFVDITDQVKWKNAAQKATYAAAAVDYDTDGDGDIFVARIDGVFYYENQGNFSFSEETRVATFLEETAVPTGITLGDVNSDGQVDMFVSTNLRHDKIEGTTIFNREEHGTINRLLLGQGNFLFEDATQKSGLEYRHNTFVGSLVDIDNDFDLDLAVAYDTGSVRIYKNDSKGYFSRVENTPWENKFGYPMGIGIGDIDNNGLVDFFFSNTGKSLPDFVLRGDLRSGQPLFTDWTLYQNQGSGTFTEQSKIIDLEKHEFAWGGVLVDINLDGREDLIVSENYVKIPQQRIKPLPGRVFFQDENGQLLSQEKKLSLENPKFSLSSLVTDWNKDGIQDIVWVNIDGPSQVYVSRVAAPKSASYIQVPYEARFLGSQWRVALADGSNIYWQYVPSEGLGSNQTRSWFLPLGLQPEQITVTFPNGTSEDGKQYLRSGQ